MNLLLIWRYFRPRFNKHIHYSDTTQLRQVKQFPQLKYTLDIKTNILLVSIEQIRALLGDFYFDLFLPQKTI